MRLANVGEGCFAAIALLTPFVLFHAAGLVPLHTTSPPALEPEPPSRNVSHGPPMMRLFVGRASFSKPIIATCYVRCDDPAQTVTLRVPTGLALMPGERPTKGVGFMGEHGFAVIKWRLRANELGEFNLSVAGAGIPTATETVRVTAGSVGRFD